MPKIPPLHEQSDSSRSKDSLVERVRSRVSNTERALRRRDLHSRPGLSGASLDQPSPASRASRGEAPSGELRALNAVYHQLGRTHRLYRERTGESTPASLKAAARAFKQEPSVFSLVAVAGHLDELNLLTW